MNRVFCYVEHDHNNTCYLVLALASMILYTNVNRYKLGDKL